MIAELRALRDKITAAGVPAHIGQVPGSTDSKVPTPPFASLRAPGFDLHDDETLTEDGSVASFDVRVGVTETTDSNVYVSLAAVRAAVAPGLGPVPLDVPGRHAAVQWVRSEFVTTDRDVTYGATNRHPGFGVDTYRITSQPTT